MHLKLYTITKPDENIVTSKKLTEIVSRLINNEFNKIKSSNKEKNEEEIEKIFEKEIINISVKICQMVNNEFDKDKVDVSFEVFLKVINNIMVICYYNQKLMDTSIDGKIIGKESIQQQLITEITEDINNTK